jgi:serine/threonine protein kinase
MAEDRVGQQLGNYRLIKRLGEGGFAEVYQGEHLYLKTQAAIKVLHTRLAEDDMESFVSEAQTIARLKHPHIVRVLEFGVEGSTPFLVMDYAPNGTLRQRHRKGTVLALTVILPYVNQVAEALHYAHDQKLVHRDVKPENMLIGERKVRATRARKKWQARWPTWPRSRCRASPAPPAISMHSVSWRMSG